MTISWWKGAVIYQVYPRSFQDSDGDGIGDLAGIEQRLDYLVDLGVDAVWLSPIFPSPMADFGYDISDHRGVDPRFGTLGDLDRLVAAAHARGLRLILDYVPNHTSDQHPWFKDSRAARDAPRRDWYIWADPAPGGGPPNNWLSNFGGSAWAWDASTGQYYLHAFLKDQPDLNWRNPAVQAAMLDVLRFWLDRGIDGFRIDVLWHLIKAEGLPDNPPNPDWTPLMGDEHRLLQRHSADQDAVHPLAARMRRLTDSYPGERILIGEVYLPIDRLVRYYGDHGAPEMHLPFNFHLIACPWTADAVRALVAEYEAALPPGAWPNWVLGNHDRPRIAARIGQAQARVAAMLLLTLRGTPTLYYGDELGIGAVAIPPQAVRDPWELNEPGLGLGRDPVRTPMAWSRAAGGGFSRGEPWLPLHPDWPARNVEAELEAPQSLLRLYRRLLALRRVRPALALGELRLLQPHPGVLAYERRLGDDRLLAALNLTGAPQALPLPDWARGGRILVSTLPGSPPPAADGLRLRPDEGIIMSPPGGPGS